MLLFFVRLLIEKGGERMSQKKLIKVGHKLVITFRKGYGTSVELFNEKGIEVLFPGVSKSTYAMGVDLRERSRCFLRTYEECHDSMTGKIEKFDWNAFFFSSFVASLYNLDCHEDLNQREISSSWDSVTMVYIFCRKKRIAHSRRITKR